MNQHQLLSHLPPGPMSALNYPHKFLSNGYGSKAHNKLATFFLFVSLPNLFVTLRAHRPLRGGEKLELPQAMLAGLPREQQQRPPPPPPHLHAPPPHRTWAQLGQLYDSHLPPQDHPLVPLHSEHSIRLHNGGYAGSGGPSPSPSPHHPHSRPNQVLKVGRTSTTHSHARFKSSCPWRN